MSRPSLHSAQASFLEAILGGSSVPPEGMMVEVGALATARLGVYRSAYRARLREVLRSDHPATARALASAFDSTAEDYARRCPSGGHSLRDAGASFVTFLDALPRLEAQALAELARFERVLLDAFDAADATRCDELVRGEGVLASIRMHPSVRHVEGRWNTLEHWHATRDEAEVPAWSRVDTTVIVWRGRDLRTSFRAIGPEESRLIRSLLEHESFAGACEALSECMPLEAIPGFAIDRLRRWIADGMVHEVVFEPLTTTARPPSTSPPPAGSTR